MPVFYKTVDEIIKEEEKGKDVCPIPLEVFPNKMGINLVSVEAISWHRQDDGQLKQLTVHFDPADEEEKEAEGVS